MFSFFIYMISNINKRNTDYHWQFTYWTIDKKYWLSWKLLKQKLRSYFRRCVFCLFSTANFYTAIVQENRCCSVSGWIVQVVYSFAPIIWNKLHAMLFTANVHEFILLPRISSLGKRKQFMIVKFSILHATISKICVNVVSKEIWKEFLFFAHLIFRIYM